MLTFSRLDNDLYNFTMGQVIWKYWRDFEVKYKFTCRNPDIKLGDYVGPRSHLSGSELGRQIGQYWHTTFAPDEIDYLRSTGLFCDEYLSWLTAGHKLPPVSVSTYQGDLHLSYTGRWADAVFWETPLLALVNEQYFRSEDPSIQGHKLLDQKMVMLKNSPNVRFLEFGTRRRHSQEWQHTVIERLIDNNVNIAGTSNPMWAKEFGLPCSGTMAHQLFMVLAAKRIQQGGPYPIFDAERDVMLAWHSTYKDHPEMMVCVTDTFGSKRFLHQHADVHRLYNWGFRQDSGNAVEIGRLYGEYNPSRVIFSNGLIVPEMVSLEGRFRGSFPVRFGYGTDLTCSVGMRPLNIVIKPESVDGAGCVKLSDDLGKAMGAPEDIDRYRVLARRT